MFLLSQALLEGETIPVFARTQSCEEDSLEGQVLKGVLLKGFKGSLIKLV